MPIIKSAKKRVKVAAKATTRNTRTKRTLRDALKSFTKALESGKSSEIAKAEQAAMSAIDMASKKAVIHKNKAARKKAQISAAAKAKGVKPTKKAETSKPKAMPTGRQAKSPAKPAAKKVAPKK